MSKIPYNVMRHREWDRAPRDPISIGSAIAGYFGVTSTLGTLAITGLAYVGVSLITSWAMSALAPKPDVSDTSSRGLLINAKDAVAPHDFVYGQVRKGGTVTYYETTGEANRYLHQIVVLAGHEVEEIGDIYINDEVVTLDGDGLVTSSPWNSKIRVKKHLGTSTQAADADLLAESEQISAEFQGKGIAYLYVRYEYDQEVFANGLPLITAVVKGRKVYDPRTSSTAYSNNAALCVRDYLTASYGLSDSQIDDTVFSAAANICDESVTLAEGGTEARYTVNGVVKADQNHGDVLQNMMTACAGSLFWGAGAWKLVVADYVAPVKTLGLDDLRGPISLSTRVNLRDQFNGVQGTFNNSDDRWIVSDYPPITSATFQAEDGGEETLLDFPLTMTTSSATAQRLAKLTLYRGREQMTLTADFGLNAFDVEVGEIIALTNDRYGWTEKEFEVVGWSFGASEAGDLRVTLTLRETSEAAFDWDAEETAIIANNSTLLQYYEVPALGLSASDELAVYFEKLSNKVTLQTSSSQSALIDYIQLEYKSSSESAWTELGNAQLGTFAINDLQDGTYDFRARAVNAFGVKGAYKTRSNYVVDGLSQPPQDVTGLTAEVNGDTINLSWDAVPDLDLSYYAVRHAKETSGASWSGSISYVEKVARPSTEVSVPSRAGTYLVKAVDKTGVQSVNAATVVVTEDEVYQRGTNLTQTENPSFSGTKSGTIVAASNLRLGTVSLFDDLSGNIDDLTGDFDDLGIDYTGTSGTYYFADYIDRGAVEQAFVTVQIKTQRFDTTGGLFDDLAGNIDALPGLFDDLTGGADFDDTNVVSYVSTTDDDPAGSPTWSDWRKIRAANIYCRAMRFKVDLASDAAGISPAISELSATASYA